MRNGVAGLGWRGGPLHVVARTGQELAEQVEDDLFVVDGKNSLFQSRRNLSLYRSDPQHDHTAHNLVVIAERIEIGDHRLAASALADHLGRAFDQILTMTQGPS